VQTADASQGPKLIKVLVNKGNATFEDVEDAQEPEVAQILELTEEQVRDGIPVPLRFVRFQSVSSLQVRMHFDGSDGHF
jgi:hypothetical protein